jgi:hypothetical protein
VRRKPTFIPGRLYRENYLGENNPSGETIFILEVSLPPETIVVECVRFLATDGTTKLEIMVPQNWLLIS